MENKPNLEAVPEPILWHVTPGKEALTKIESNAETGLSTTQVEERLARYGANKLPEAKPDTLLTIFFQQFKSSLIYLLLAAAVIVILLEEYVDAGIIMFVLLFNAVAGTFQAGRAQNTLLALRQFTKTQATVLRDGEELVIPAEEVVPGDIIILQEGEKVPADARLLEDHNLRTDEAALTGESNPVSKSSDLLDDPKATTADQANMVFMGTHVVAGTGKAVVIATGLKTVIGKISDEMTTIDSKVPLQEGIDYLSRIIVTVVLIMSVIIFLLGLFFSDMGGGEIFMVAVAVVVSTVPEGLPIVMTLLLATGVWRMSKRNVLIKRLQAVEALGEAQVIAVDKTGTVTKNELVVQQAYVGGQMYHIEGVGYEATGDIKLDGKTIDPGEHSDLTLLARIGLFCNNARLNFDQEKQKWDIAGDPTEAALAVFGQKLALDEVALKQGSPQIDEIPFDSKLKYHAVLHNVDGANFLAAAGAPEIMLEHCKYILDNGKEREITDADKAELTRIFTEMSEKALRVIALVKKEAKDIKLDENAIQELTFVGFTGMKDALRSEVFDAMSTAREAGIRVVMITGDHSVTAQAIAEEAGIFKPGDEILTNVDIESLSDEELAERLGHTSVFARITPEHKFRIISAYRLRGEIVAMTGDGVNDALSLVAADLGVAMGKTGTEVAKEASDLILLDDNFGSIISAVEEGRNIYKNMKKVLLYLFSTNLGELMVIFVSVLMGWPLPVIAVQLLWINLVTDGFIDVAIAMEKKEPGLLKEKFRKPKKWIIDSLMVQRMLLMSTTMAVATLLTFNHYLETDYVHATTIAMTTMVVFQWYKALTVRSEHGTIFKINPFSNRYLVAAITFVAGSHIFMLNSSLGQRIFQVVPLSLREWGIILLIGLSTIAVDETRKFFYRRFQLKKDLVTPV